MTHRILTIVLSFFLMVSCSKDEQPSAIPGTPTTMSPEDGVMITSTAIELQAGGSIAESGDDAEYDFYLGTDPENMTLTGSRNIANLTPGVQYYWKAVPYTLTGNDKNLGTPSPVRSFYTTPSAFKGLVSDNGETETAVVLKWTKPANCKQVKITFTPECADVQQPIIIPGDQESCVLTQLLDFKTVTKSYVKYTFTVEPTVTIGDKDYTLNALTVDEIPLNKKNNVRDADFNVYTLVKIGNQIWLKENLRTKRLNDGTELIKNTDYVESSESDKYGLYYSDNAMYEGIYSVKRNIEPKGFHVACLEDWVTLFRYLGASEEETTFTNFDEKYICTVSQVGSKLKSGNGWESVNGIDGNGSNLYNLTILPGGCFDIDRTANVSIGKSGYFHAIDKTETSMYTYKLRFDAESNGVYKVSPSSHAHNYYYSSIRCVKNAE